MSFLLAVVLAFVPVSKIPQTADLGFIGNWHTTAPAPTGRDAPTGPTVVAITEKGGLIAVNIDGQTAGSVKTHRSLSTSSRTRAALTVVGPATNPNILYVLRLIDSDTLEIEMFTSFADPKAAGTYRLLGTYKRAN